MEYYVGDGISGSPELRVILRNMYGVDLEFISLPVTATSLMTGDISCTVSSTSWTRESTVEIRCPIDSNDFVRRQRYDFTITGTFRQASESYQHTLRGWVSDNAQ